MTDDATGYSPIDCDFHDILEAVATTRETIQVTFLDAKGLPQQRSGRIVDIFSRGGAEFLSISTGETVRLDHLTLVVRSEPNGRWLI